MTLDFGNYGIFHFWVMQDLYLQLYLRDIGRMESLATHVTPNMQLLQPQHVDPTVGALIILNRVLGHLILL